jgi:hypothetical protein
MEEDRHRGIFTADDISRMRQALTRACAALAFAFPMGEVDSATRETLARAIIEVADAGETNPMRLSSEVLRKLPPLLAHSEAVKGTF